MKRSRSNSQKPPIWRTIFYVLLLTLLISAILYFPPAVSDLARIAVIVFISLLASLIANDILGYLEIEGNVLGLSIKAGGSIAAFIITLFVANSFVARNLTFVGFVFENSDARHPVEGATIRPLGKATSVLTDKEGKFVLEGASSIKKIEIKSNRFHTEVFNFNPDAEDNVFLLKPIRIDAVEILIKDKKVAPKDPSVVGIFFETSKLPGSGDGTLFLTGLPSEITKAELYGVEVLPNEGIVEWRVSASELRSSPRISLTYRKDVNIIPMLSDIKISWRGE